VSALTENTGKPQSVCRQLVVLNMAGMHARPAAAFVKIAGQYSSEISVTKDGDTVNGKSIIGLLSLAVGKGQNISVEASGVDAMAALDALQELVDARFEED